MVRLDNGQIQALIRAVRLAFGSSARLWLFGSRTDCEARGGDIDLYVETERATELVAATLHMHSLLWPIFGEQKIDIVVRYCGAPATPIQKIAKSKGVELTGPSVLLKRGNSFYIATSLERIKDHNLLRDFLSGHGLKIAHDWTVHGNQKNSSKERLSQIADNMMAGVQAADVVIILLPGGCGTHTEFGIALGAGKAIIIHADDERYFLPTEQTSAFYHSPAAIQITCPFEELSAVLWKTLAS